MLHKFLSLTLLVVLVAASCGKESVQSYECTGTVPTYTGAIKVILDTRCAISGCHSAASKADGIDLSTYASAKQESAKDAFLGSIEHLSGYKKMPEGSAKLPDSTIQKIYCWVNNGTPQ